MQTRIYGQSVLTIVLAGGKGSRLGALTAARAKPAVPFLGTYRLIDFALSNAVNSGLADVWILEQYLPHSLNVHLAGGRPWDLDRTRGGLEVMPPFSGPDEEDGGFSKGNAHALALHADLIEESGAELVLVLSADHLYRLDYAEVVRAHLDHGAEVTMVTTEVPRGEDPARFSQVQASGERITRFAYKPEQQLSSEVTCEVFLYNADVLLPMLRQLEREEGEIGDYGDTLLPRLVERGSAYRFPLDGYWLDVGTLGAYMQAHADALAGKSPQMADPQWPFRTASITPPPAHIHAGARVEDSLVCGGAEVGGTVTRSLIGPGAVVEAGAVVEDSVLQPHAVVRAGATVRRAIVDEGALVGEHATVGGPDADATLCVVGMQAQVQRGAHLEAGWQLPPHSRLSKNSGEGSLEKLEAEMLGE